MNYSDFEYDVNDFLTVNHYYINPMRLVELVIDSFGYDDVTDEVINNCLIIKLMGVDLIKVYLTDDYVYDYGKNSIVYNARFYLNKGLCDEYLIG